MNCVVDFHVLQIITKQNLKTDYTEVVMAVVKKKKKIINTPRNPHSRTIFRDWLYHYWLMLYVNNLYYNCVNRETYPYNWDVV
jgi:hypothetical protein